MPTSHRFALNFLLHQQDDDLIPGESGAFDAQLECHISRMDSLSLRKLRVDPNDWEEIDDGDPEKDFADYLDASDALDMAEFPDWAARGRRYS
jgi:hypothetical protein